MLTSNAFTEKVEQRLIFCKSKRLDWKLSGSFCSRAANSNSKELDLFAELELKLVLETQNFVGLGLENI